jgi:transposase
VLQHVREKFSCRSCEAITQPPAPSHPIARGRAGPKLLAHILFSKYGLHLPLTRQSAVYGREGIDLDVSTLADWVGASAATLMPLAETIRAHVFAAERIHADDTTVPVLAKGKTRTGRLCSTPTTQGARLWKKEATSPRRNLRRATGRPWPSAA